MSIRNLDQDRDSESGLSFGLFSARKLGSEEEGEAAQTPADNVPSEQEGIGSESVIDLVSLHDGTKNQETDRAENSGLVGRLVEGYVDLSFF